MKKIIILIPVFNDWESLKKLLSEINQNIDNIKNAEISCVVVNDASTKEQPEILKPKNLSSLKIMNMNRNKGHARCYAFGIRFVLTNENFDNLILMDGDGEDRPYELKELIELSKKENNFSIVAKRVKRSEGSVFRSLYQIHKLITLIFTGKNINFGNYSCLTKRDVEKLSSQSSLWSSISGTIKKNIPDLNEINSTRGTRYFGPSQMSFLKLLIHSFSIIAVFKYQVFLRSIIFFITLFYSVSYLGIFSYIFQIILVIFNLLIFLVSLRESKEELVKSHENLKNIEKITH